MNTKLTALIVKLTLISSTVLSYSAMANDQWGMYQANPAHTGYIPVTVNPDNIVFGWKKKIGTTDSGNLLSPVTVGGGHLFISTPGYYGNQYLYTLRKNGSLAWGKAFTRIVSVNPPSYADDKVYMQTVNNSGDTYLRSYDAVSGKTLFLAPHGAQMERYLAPTIYKGTVYINGGSYGGMYSFDGKKGRENWFFSELPQVDGWTPAVDDKWAYTYINSLYAVDRLTGELAFKILSPGQQAVPMLGGLNDVFVNDSGTLTKFKTDTRQIAWQKVYGIQQDFAGQPALANRIVYIGTTLGSLAAVAQGTGKILWTWKNPEKSPVINNIVVTKSHAFLSTDTKVYAIDLATHQNVWTYAVSGHLTLAEGSLYVAAKDGTLTAFRLGIADIFAPANSFFPATKIDATTAKNIVIRNVGTQDLNVSEIISPSFVFKVKTATPFVIAPNQSKAVAVEFTPVTTAVFNTTLTVKTNDENEPETLIFLKGQGIL
jgi:outer membrane protein assembly factor BamB